MSKKLKIVFCVLLLLAIGLGLCYKAFLVWNDASKNIDATIHTAFNNIEEKEIYTDKSYQNANIGSMHYYVPEGYILNKANAKTNQKSYDLKEEGSNKTIGMFIIGESDLNSVEEIEKIIDSNILTKLNTEKLFKKYNIKDEVDLYKYFKEHHNKKRNIFWGISHLQMDGFVDMYISLNQASGPNMHSYFLTKDLKGYMTIIRNHHFAFITYQGKNYTVSFGNVRKEEDNKTTQEFLKILASISFE